MKLVVGLGNPGNKYEKTRHNIGFILLDEIAGKSFRSDTKKNGLVSKKNGLIYLKPQTFMNDSGESVAKFKKFYKIKPDSVIVIRDDLDMPAGALRMRYGSTSGGHKGIESIIARLKTKNFWQIKAGIGKSLDKSRASDYVLKKMSNQEAERIKKLAPKVKELIENPENTSFNILTS